MTKIDCSINHELIAIKVINFLSYAGLACFVPFKSVFQKQLGMTSTQNGIIQATMTITSMFSQPISGIITDKTKAYKAILVVCFAMSILSTVPMILIPAVEKIPTLFSCRFAQNTTVQCHEQDSVDLQSCEVRNQNQTLLLKTEVEYFDELILINVTRNVTMYCHSKTAVYDQTFALLMFLTVLLSIFMMPINALVDSTVMDILGEKRRHMYGHQRLWGAIGFGSVALLIGYLIEAFSNPSSLENNYIPSMIGVAIFWILSSLACIKLKVAALKAASVFDHLGVLLKQPVILGFLFVVFVCGFSTGVHFTYFFWYLETLEGGTKTIMGFSLFVTCASEVPMFLISGYLCEKLGYIPILSIGLITIAIRFMAYTFVKVSWQVLFVELLHGITFALPLSAMCSYAVVIAPKSLIATLITLSQAVYWGLGNMCGALLGGVIYEEMGGKWTFRITAAICFVVGCLYWCTACIHKQEKTSVKEPPEASPEVTNDQEDVKEKLMKNSCDNKKDDDSSSSEPEESSA